MNKKRPYPPAKVAAKGKRPGTEKFVALARKKYGFTNLGTWVVRDMRGKPGVLSTHATGRAMDLGYQDRKTALAAMEFLVANNAALGVTLINDYAHGKHGRTWICDRQAWKVHDRPTIGTRGSWIHVELDAWAADDPTALSRVWADLQRSP